VIGSYAAGVASALAAGAAYNVGQLAQKVAVNRLGADFRGACAPAALSSSPRLAPLAGGFAVVLFAGTPLNVVAALWLGPPSCGLMSLGLVVLAVRSGDRGRRAARSRRHRRHRAGDGRHRPRRREPLRIDVSEAGLHAGDLARLAAFTLCTASLGTVLLAAAGRTRGARGPLRALAAGLFYAPSNLWLAELMNALDHWLAGGPIREGLDLAAAALGIIVASSILGTVVIQHAYRVGNASRVVPIQMVPQQVVPILAFLLVFRARPRTGPPLAAAGAHPRRRRPAGPGGRPRQGRRSALGNGDM
jgi:hypothetical protein